MQKIGLKSENIYLVQFKKIAYCLPFTLLEKL